MYFSIIKSSYAYIVDCYAELFASGVLFRDANGYVTPIYLIKRWTHVLSQQIFTQ